MTRSDAIGRYLLCGVTDIGLGLWMYASAPFVCAVRPTNQSTNQPVLERLRKRFNDIGILTASATFGAEWVATYQRLAR